MGLFGFFFFFGGGVGWGEGVVILVGPGYSPWAHHFGVFHVLPKLGEEAHLLP